MPRPLFIDTNILLEVPKGFDLFRILEREYPHMEASIVEGTIKELKGLSEKGTGREKRAALLALRLAQEQHLNIVPQSAGYVDAALLAEAQRSGGTIITLDRELQREARKRGIPVLTIRQRRFLRPVL